MAVVILLLAGLACSLGPTASPDPIFIAPEGIVRSTDTGVSSHPSEASTPDPLPASTPIAEAISENPPPQGDSPQEPVADVSPYLYYTQAGDTLPVLAVRFGVEPSEIVSPDPIPESTLLNPGQLLVIPRRQSSTTPGEALMPDSEVVFSPSAADFDVDAFIRQAGGYLSRYNDFPGNTGRAHGAEVVHRIALENSINPRVLLALLEYQSGWVFGQPQTQMQIDYPMGLVNLRYKSLGAQLGWAVTQLSNGYYGWREGRLTEIRFRDGSTARLAPELNAGTASVQYFFAQLYDREGWERAMHPEDGFFALHQRMFGDPWVRAQNVEPLYPADLDQPPLILPFMANQIWAFTGGPHGAWQREGAYAAVDFAPGSLEPGCVKSDAWAVASAAGLVVRSENAVVAIDLDGDGREQTGWVLMYLHIAKEGRIPAGQWVQAGDPIGHPSCEGGFSTGTHIHIARKYNGEWIPADGPLPFVLSGWRVHAGDRPYDGTMTRDGQTIISSTLGASSSRIIRSHDDP